MAFDGAFLRLVIQELTPLCVGCRVDKIYQPTKSSLVLFLRSKTFAGKLLLSAQPGAARIQLTRAEIENPATPPMLCMLLRKKLVGAKLTALRQPGLERSVYLDFDTKNELGDPVTLTLVGEFMGRNANLILCDETGKVIDAIRRTDAADTTRILMPGVTYMPPPANSTFDLTKDPADQPIKRLEGVEKRNLASALLEVIPGISPIVCRELTHNIPGEDHLPLSPSGADRLQENIRQLQRIVCNNAGRPTQITDPNGKTVDFTFISPVQYGDGYTKTEYDSYQLLLDGYYTSRDQKARMQTKTSHLTKWLNNTVARLSRTINVRQTELAKARNCDHLRKYGELLKANMGRIQPGATHCRVIDYYDPDCKEIEIPLSPALNPAGNAAKYFKAYRKQCTAAGMLTELIEKAQQDMAYLISVQEALSRAQTTGEVGVIEEELTETGWLKPPRGSKKGKVQKQKEPAPYVFVSDDGFTIFAGRNNRQNDALTLRRSAGNDLWFHTKNIPGSHVIIKTDGVTPPDTTLTQAATIAATLSAAAESTGVAVDYCPVKRVKKPSGAAPGMVIYENYNTCFVNPDKGLIQRLKQEEKSQ